MWRNSIVCTFIRRFCSNVKDEMKYLNVAEKPDAAKTISRLLSNGTAIRREGLSVYNKIFEFDANVKGKNVKMLMTSVSGHILHYEFAGGYRGWQNCDPHQLFDAPVKKICMEDSEKIKKTLEREIRSCQALVIWTDCDREGENIGFEIIDVCKAVKPNISVYRAKFSEITAAAVRRALATLAQPDIQKSQAVDVRSQLDLRTGAAFTRYQTMRLQRMFPVNIENKLVSYGSCQIPTLGFVAQRYKETEAFVPEPFWKIKVTHTIDDLTVEFHWARNRLFDKEACEDYLMLCLADPKATVDNVTTKPKNKWRPNPMDTVELEKLGSRKLKLNAKTVMTIAEKLYTQGFISYPRTETNIFSPDVNLRSLVEMQTAHSDWGAFASRVLEWGPNPRNGKKSDQAHPPIHPTKFVAGLSGNEQRVYELIVRHFLACVSKDATGSETIVNITIAGEKFSATGLCIYERNYLDVYPYEKWNAKEIHRYEIGQVFDPTEISMQEGSTTAPPLLTEADLIALMEKHGIGTDATHAEHIENIKQRGYIGEVDRGLLVPGTIGMGLYEGYEAMELPLAQPMLRAGFESDLKKICTGEKNPNEVLREQIVKYKEAYKIITEKIRAFDEKIAQRLNETPQESNQNEATENRNQEIFKCPKCVQSSMTLRQKKDSNDFFIGCLGFPDCKNAIWFREGIKEVKASESHCSRCGPTYRKIEVKFKQSSYLALLNAESNVYVTCLACDSKFRDIFEINIDSVKRVGGIVANESTNAGNRTNVNARTNVPRQTSSGRDRGNSTMTNNRGGARRNLSTRNVEPRGRNTNVPESNNSENERTASTVEADLQDLGDEFFNDDFLNDDGFDELILNSHLEAETLSNSNERNERRNSDWNNERTNNERNNTENNSLFSSWGTSGNSRHNQGNSQNNEIRNGAPNHMSSWGTSANSGQQVPNNTRNDLSNSNNASRENQARGSGSNNSSWPRSDPQRNSNQNRDDNNPLMSSWGSANNPRPQSDAVKCSGCHQVAKELIVRKDGPNKGRTFYTCPKQQPCKFFQWADESLSPPVEPNLPSRSSSQTVLCPSCNLPAKELTVRKDGPNKGRLFYACASSNPCRFFKWADENGDPNTNQPSTSSWGAGTSRPTRDDQSQEPARKKRKCGLCRQEGHTKNKCARRN